MNFANSLKSIRTQAPVLKAQSPQTASVTGLKSDVKLLKSILHIKQAGGGMSEIFYKLKALQEENDVLRAHNMSRSIETRSRISNFDTPMTYSNLETGRNSAVNVPNPARRASLFKPISRSLGRLQDKPGSKEKLRSPSSSLFKNNGPFLQAKHFAEKRQDKESNSDFWSFRKDEISEVQEEPIRGPIKSGFCTGKEASHMVDQLTHDATPTAEPSLQLQPKPHSFIVQNSRVEMARSLVGLSLKDFEVSSAVKQPSLAKNPPSSYLIVKSEVAVPSPSSVNSSVNLCTKSKRKKLPLVSVFKNQVVKPHGSLLRSQPPLKNKIYRETTSTNFKSALATQAALLTDVGSGSVARLRFMKSLFNRAETRLSSLDRIPNRSSDFGQSSSNSQVSRRCQKSIERLQKEVASFTFD